MYKLFKRLINFCLSVLVVGLLFSCLFWFQTSSNVEVDKKIVTELTIAALPPPPRPEPLKKNIQSSPVSNKLNVIDLAGDVKVDYGETTQVELPKQTDFSLPNFDTEQIIDLSGFKTTIPLIEVSLLDDVPEVIAQKRVKLPREAKKNASGRIETIVELIIDETGKPYIKKIIDAKYQEMRPIIKEWVKYARFEVPRKEGKPVQAAYLYHLNFNYGK
ncbi:hypothetical protein [Pseudoalteromonas phenolica]|uniref:hypothetical protein n=1 Tax=Pseudoalteromonas phenolica TaxID=161398 RepID=UPI00110A9BC3|nr:hypothetical protein [Pseudoalteromonas phenolica]TMO57250.1 hypothetical protein CWC21_05055 [Pseudoalteromonas phenolica]